MNDQIFTDPSDDQAFRREGFCLLSAPPSLLQEGKEIFRRIGLSPEAPFVVTQIMDDLPLAQTISRAIVSASASWLGQIVPSYRPVTAGLSIKGAQSSAIRLHRDATMVNENRYTSLGFWIPLQDCPLERGCLGVVPGSHHQPIVVRPLGNGILLPVEDEERNRHRIVPLPMRAGQAVVFDNKLFHGSFPNNHATPRAAIVLTCIPGRAQLLGCWMDSQKQVEVFHLPDDYYLTRGIARPSDLSPKFRLPFRAAQLAPV